MECKNGIPNTDKIYRNTENGDMSSLSDCYRDMADKNDEITIPLRLLLSGYFRGKFEPLLSPLAGILGYPLFLQCLCLYILRKKIQFRMFCNIHFNISFEITANSLLARY